LLQTIKGLRTLYIQFQRQNPHLSLSHFYANNLDFVVKLFQRFCCWIFEFSNKL
jgi:hypothetical protein